MEPRSAIWKSLVRSNREIRLFILSPSRDEDAVPRGRLITVSLDQQQHLRFDAISHAWGRPSEPETIYIDEVEWLVSASVFKALQRLRHQSEERTYWIDALCVDQQNLKERAEQTSLMQYVFSRAANVQVWLGAEPSMINWLVDAMNNKPFVERLFSQANSPETRNLIDKLVELARLGYWSRTWIIQEVALARNVRFVFGPKTFTMSNLQFVYDQFEVSSSSTSGVWQRNSIRSALGPVFDASRIPHIATVGNPEQKAIELTRTLYRARQSQCSDARDRIYGLLGVMTAMFNPSFILPNYEHSVATVYTQFASSLIAHTASLVLLNQAEYSGNSTLGLPSFVPDWTSPFRHYQAFRRTFSYERFAAAGEMPTIGQPHAPSLIKASVLKCSGHVFGTVETVGAVCRAWTGPLVRTNLALLLEDWRRLYSGAELSFRRTINSDAQVTLSSLDAWYALLQTPGDSMSATELQDFFTLRDSVTNRRFFVTGEGAPGLGPEDTRPGDVLVVLAGGRVPCVLRNSPHLTQKKSLNTPKKTPDARSLGWGATKKKSPSVKKESPTVYSFVGECYVDGVMHGELFAKADPPKLKDVWLG